MPSMADLWRAWLVAQLGADPVTASEADLQNLVLSNTGGVAENRRFATGLYYGQDNSGGNSTRVPVLNELDVFPFPVGQRTTFDQIACACTILQATAVYRLGIYASDGHGKPGNLIVDAGTVDCSTVGAKTININQTLNPGMYWLAGCMQVAAGVAELRAYAAGWTMYIGLDDPSRNTAGTGYAAAGVAGALPSPFPFAANNAFSGATPRLLLRST